MLEEKLLENAESDIYPFHMPGHKRRLSACDSYKIDITEIEGFDNLHHAQGILKEAQEKAARLYGSKKAYYLVNGSTCGILAAVSAATSKRDKVIVARNSHKAVYNALYLNELIPTYVYPVITDMGIQGQISVDSVQKAIEETEDASAVIITSPTYDGISSDIARIAELAHAKGMVLIVDSAHGAHFGFGYGMPENVIKQGADIVIESVHKTLPAYTQTALLHICSDRVKPEAIERYLDIYETSSPSYVLMAGIERCIDMVADQKDRLFGGLQHNLDSFYNKVSGLKHLKVLTKADLKADEAFDFDRSKIIILTDKAGMSGQDMWDILLRKYHIQIEMAAGNYAVALSSIIDAEEGFDRLAEALVDIDQGIECDRYIDICKTADEGLVTDVGKTTDGVHDISVDINIHECASSIKDSGKSQAVKAGKYSNYIVNAEIYHPNERSLEIFEAEDAYKTQCKYEAEEGYKTQDIFGDKEACKTQGTYEVGRTHRLQALQVPLDEAAGQVSASYINLYPPGIPLVVPGEIISPRLVKDLKTIIKLNLELQGLTENNFITILKG